MTINKKTLKQKQDELKKKQQEIKRLEQEIEAGKAILGIPQDKFDELIDIAAELMAGYEVYYKLPNGPEIEFFIEWHGDDVPHVSNVMILPDNRSKKYTLLVDWINSVIDECELGEIVGLSALDSKSYADAKLKSDRFWELFCKYEKKYALDLDKVLDVADDRQTRLKKQKLKG